MPPLEGVDDYVAAACERSAVWLVRDWIRRASATGFAASGCRLKDGLRRRLCPRKAQWSSR